MTLSKQKRAADDVPTEAFEIVREALERAGERPALIAFQGIEVAFWLLTASGGRESESV